METPALMATRARLVLQALQAPQALQALKVLKVQKVLLAHKGQ
jgi:hypothetical protein